MCGVHIAIQMLSVRCARVECSVCSKARNVGGVKLSRLRPSSARQHTVIRLDRLHIVIRHERLHTVIRLERLHIVIRLKRLHIVIRIERLHNVIRLETTGRQPVHTQQPYSSGDARCAILTPDPNVTHSYRIEPPQMYIFWRQEVTFYRATAKHTHGIPVEILSVCLSVCLSNAWIVTKRKHLAKKFNYG